MKGILTVILFLSAFAVSSYATNYYAHPSGTAAIGSCDFASHAAAQAASSSAHCSLYTVLNSPATTGSSDTIYLRGGTYLGKFTSSMDGGTVRSFCTVLTGGCAANPSEWAVIDGNISTTLVGDINDSQTNITVADGTKVFITGGSAAVSIDGEIVVFCNKSGNNLTSCIRGGSGSVAGAVAHSNGATVYQAGQQLDVIGTDTTYRDFESTNSNTIRNEDTYPRLARGHGINNIGDRNSFINIVIHDNVTGFFTGSSSSDTLIYGIINYNTGMVGLSGEEVGHGYYLENGAGYSRVYESMSLNAFNLGMQGYGVTGPYVGGDIRGSIFVGAGTPIGEYHYNMVYGPADQISPTGSVTECYFHHAPSTNSFSVIFGYGSGVETGTFTNNYFFGAGTAFEVGEVTTLTFSGNKFYSSGAADRYVLSPDGYTWDNNTYYNTTTQNRFNNLDGVGSVNFTAWKAATGYDAASTATGSALPDQVIIRPNEYETGRANLIIYAPSGATSINVNLSTTGLIHGQSYVIKNAFDWNGGDVATGTYNSGSPTVSVPLTGEADDVAAPIGVGGDVVTPDTTCPTFCVLVVLPSSQGSGVRAAMGGSVKLSGTIKLQ